MRIAPVEDVGGGRNRPDFRNTDDPGFFRALLLHLGDRLVGLLVVFLLVFREDLFLVFFEEALALTGIGGRGFPLLPGERFEDEVLIGRELTEGVIGLLFGLFPGGRKVEAGGEAIPVNSRF